MSFALPPDSMLYPHRCTIWRYTETINATTGKVGAKTWAIVASGVLCNFETGTSNHGIAMLLRDEGDNQFSKDKVTFKLTADLKAGDVLKQTTGPEAPGFWEVEGEPQFVQQFGQYQQVMAAKKPAAPPGVS